MSQNVVGADSSDQAVAIWSTTCWDYWFEFRWRHGCPSLVSAVCCQVQVSATGRSPVQRRTTDYGVSVCVVQKPHE